MSEREIVLRERAAFEAGASFHYQEECERFRLDRSTASRHIDYTAVRDEAKRRYAVKITRPRIVEDPHSGANSFWRGDGKYGDSPVILHSTNRFMEKECWAMTGWGPLATSERIKLWADLLARPTEEVEDV